MAFYKTVSEPKGGNKNFMCVSEYKSKLKEDSQTDVKSTNCYEMLLKIKYPTQHLQLKSSQILSSYSVKYSRDQRHSANHYVLALFVIWLPNQSKTIMSLDLWTTMPWEKQRTKIVLARICYNFALTIKYADELCTNLESCYCTIELCMARHCHCLFFRQKTTHINQLLTDRKISYNDHDFQWDASLERLTSAMGVSQYFK